MTSKICAAAAAIVALSSVQGFSTDVVGSPIEVWSDAADNHVRDVVYNPENDEYLVLIENNWGGSDDIYAQRVDSDGTLLTWFSVITGAGESHVEPSAAYNPARDEYLVVWCRRGGTGTDDDILARTVAWNGSSMGSVINIDVGAGYQQDPDVAYNSTDDEYLVVYDTYWTPSGLEEVSAVRVRASDGSIPGSATVASDLSDTRQYAHVAYNSADNTFLIAYTVDNARVASKLAAADLTGVGSATEREIRSDADSVSGDLGLAVGPSQFLVAWNENASGGTPGTIRARRVSLAGVPLGPTDGFVVSPGLYSWSWRDSVGIGWGLFGSFVLAWDTHDASDLDDLAGTVIRPGADGTSMETVAVCDVTPGQFYSAIDCAPSGACLVAYTEDDTVGGDTDIKAKLFRPVPFADDFETGVCSMWSRASPFCATPNVGLRVEVSWDTSGDPDPGDEVGSDADLHLLHPDGSGNWLGSYDCYQANATPDWGTAGDAHDPYLVREDADGTGPEIIQITDPQSVEYDIGVHLVDDSGFGASQATVTVYFDGTPVYQYPNKTIFDGEFWHLGSVEWPTGTVTLVDSVTAGVP
jgi:hypothetical protein